MYIYIQHNVLSRKTYYLSDNKMFVSRIVTCNM